MQRCGELTAAKNSSLVTQRKIPKKRIAAILNLLPVKDDVLALISAMDKADLKQSCNALTKDLLLVHEVDSGTLQSEFAAAERYCNQHRTSTVSSNGTITSESSIFSQSSTRSSFSCMLSQYSGQAPDQQRYFCPTCGLGCTRSNDMAAHMRNKCEPENRIRYQCHTCSVSEEREDRIRRHVDKHHLQVTSATQPLGFGEFELPVKRSFGCTHCEKSLRTLTEYHDHLNQQHYLREKINDRGSPSLRVRNGIRAAGLTERMRKACQRRGLHGHRWQSFEWDDIYAAEFWTRLEYGVKDPYSDPFSYLGIEDTAKLVAELIDRAEVNYTNDLGCGSPLDPTPFVGTVSAAELQREDLFVLDTSSPSAITAGNSMRTKEPKIVCHPRLERLRFGDQRPLDTRLPARCYAETALSAPLHQPSIPIVSAQRHSQPTLLPLTGHKHNLSEESAIHPDSADRSRASPCPLPNTVADLPTQIAYDDTTLHHAHHLSGFSFMDDQFLSTLGDASLDPSSLYTVPGEPPNIMDWDE